MKHLNFYEEYISESVKNIEYIYDTYYSKIPFQIFKKIINTDPTTTTEKMGMYSKWLLNLYASDNLRLPLEDLYKATEYLKLFHKFKHTLPVEQRNINNIKSLPDFAILVEPFREPAPEFLSSTENKEKAFVKSFKNYDLYIPTTYEQSRDLGRNTRWCTAADSGEGLYNYIKYEKKGILYILISKEDEINKFQFHFEERQFMDKFDKEIILMDFFDSNSDIKKYFKPQIDEMIEYFNFKSFEKKHNPLYPNDIYFLKDGKEVLCFDKKNNTLWVGYKILWKVIEIIHNKKHYHIQYSTIVDDIKIKVSNELTIETDGSLDVKPWYSI